MSASPGPDPAGNRDGPGPVAAVRRPWLTRNVAVLCGVSFLQDTASELLYPILPVFLTAVLGAPVAVVGIVEGAADGAAALAKVAAGRRADRTGRRPLIAAGYGLAALGKVLIALAYGWPLVLAARVIDRTGKGVRSAPRDSLLAAGVAARYRGAVFGLHRAADTAGAVAGPLLGLALYEALGHRLRPLFWIAVIPAIASVLLVRAVRDPRPGPPAAGARGARPGVPYRDLPGPYWRVLAVLTLFGLVNFPDALLLLRARQLGLSVAGVIAAYAVYNAAYAALAYPAGYLSDRLPRQVVYAAGLLFFAAGYLGLAVIGQAWLVFAVLAVYGGFNACTDGVGKAWISTLLPAAAQGTGQGLYQGATGAATLIAGVWAGLAWHGTGRLPLLVSGAIAALIAAGMLLRATRPHH
jgi:MFS family permease